MATVTELPGGTSTDTALFKGDVAGKEKIDNWRFIESRPIREDQVKNAVKFLSHPKVKDSPVVYRRSFLERKELSREEIDEAFRRVPDPPDSSPSTVPAAGFVNAPIQGPQIVKQAAQANSIHGASKSSSWTQMLLALGVLTAAGAGAGVLTKKYFIPKLKEWILNIVSGKSSHGEASKASQPNPAQEAATTAAAAAAAAAATAATQVAAAMQEIVKSKSEDRRSLDSIIRAVEAQTHELMGTLAGMKDTMQNVDVTKYQRPVSNSLQSNGGGRDDYFKGQTKSGLTSVFTSRSITAKEINDKQSNPNQQPLDPRLQPRLKPWERTALESQSNNPGVGDETSKLGKYTEGWVTSAVNTELTIGSGTTSSPEPWWRKNVGLGSSSVKITEVVATGVDIETVQVGQSSSSSSLAQSGGGQAGWVAPTVPLPGYPVAEEAIRRPMPTAGAKRTRSGTVSVSAGSASSSFQRDESPAEAEIFTDSTHSNSGLPEEQVGAPDEQEPEYFYQFC